MQHLFNKQALRDTHFRAEAPGDTFSDADKEAYLKAAEDVLHGVDHSSDTGPGMPSKVVKYHRVAAQDWIVGADHQLQTLIGRGLSLHLSPGRMMWCQWKSVFTWQLAWTQALMAFVEFGSSCSCSSCATSHSSTLCTYHTDIWMCGWQIRGSNQA